MDPKIIELVAGAFMPFLIDILNRKIANTQLRYFVSMGVCLVLGAILNIGKLNAGDILTSGSIIFAAAQTVYKTYYEKSALRQTAFGVDTTGVK
jgi:hypothetical protein